MKHVFVFDPSAFQNQEWKVNRIIDSIGEYFQKQGEGDFSIHYSHYRRNAMAIIQEEAEKGDLSVVARVYAVGGEEILYDCLNSVVYYPNMQLVSVPYGKPSDFLKMYGKDKVELFTDIASLVTAEVIPTDVIRWGVNYALNFICVGMNTGIVKKASEQGPDTRGGVAFFSRISYLLSYIWAAIDKQTAWREYKISIDDEDYSGFYSFVHIANIPYYDGKVTAASDAMPDDEFLNVALVKSANPLKTLFSVRRYLRGKKNKNCVFVKAKKVTIHSDSQMWIQIDDEFVQDTSINLSIIPHAVQIAAVNNLSYQSASA